MLSKLLYRCPLCSSFDWLQDGRCIHCGAQVNLQSSGALRINDRQESIAYWYDRVLAFGLPADRYGRVYTSERVKLYKESCRGRYAGPEGLTAVLYGREFIATVTAALFRDRIELSGAGRTWTLPFAQLLSVTVESNTLIVVDRALGPLFLNFGHNSGKKWEDGIRRALADYNQPDVIKAFFPRIILERECHKRRPRPSVSGPLQVIAGKSGKISPHPVYVLARLIVRTLVTRGLKIDLAGSEHIPRKGAAILLGNHSSFLDSILIEALTRRNIWFMAKNSQYQGRLMTWFLGLAKSFPVRRYTVDVQAVRNAIRVVQNDHILGIFPEGERSWDDRMLPFKRGTMRLVLGLGVPVIPVGISGAYGLMPRWTHRIKRVPIQIRFGSPVQIDPIPAAAQTEADIASVTTLLRGRIQALIHQPFRTSIIE